ncbi:hypothetical protein [Paenibacillus eucommiae]|uniref:Uncharacterized protein n=1 Tax=Paenibacillus eucommiae TaxID=1355755 RepID=A0ABS4IV98_9BACL|nr:hypothetical protein [Paenibacillus eucommiae]MBP1991509.1 hypothetical protein [Paenibacillus eucommiae]
MTPDNVLLLYPLKKTQESNEEIRAHLKMLLYKVKSDSRHEQIGFGIEGDELI